MNKAVPLLPVYAFMLCTLTTLLLPLPQYPDLVLFPSCIPEKLGVNQRGINKKRYSHQKGVEYSSCTEGNEIENDGMQMKK